MNNIKVSLDSRLIKPGDYFVPVKGDTFDGHQFIDKALANGAAAVSRKQNYTNSQKINCKNDNQKLLASQAGSAKQLLDHIYHKFLRPNLKF